MMRSLTSRLTLWYALIATATVGLILVGGRFYLEYSLIQGVDLLNAVEFEEIRSRVEELADSVDQEELVRAVHAHAELDASLYFFQIASSSGEILYRSDNLGSHILPEALHGHPKITYEDPELGWIRSMEGSIAGLNVNIVSWLDTMYALFDDYEKASLMVCLVIFVLSLSVGYLLSRLALRPIGAIQETARRIGVSRFGERIPVPNTGDELERLAVLLNAMLDRLERSYEQVKRFTAEASHEFRTPLSILRLHTERLLGNPDLSSEEREKALSEQMEEVERLNHMIDDLLFLAKADAGVIRMEIRSVALQSFLDDLRSDAEILAEEKGIRFLMKNSPVATWRLDPSLIRQVLLNLIVNAIRYSKSGTTITLSVEPSQGNLVLMVSDEGPGVPEEKLGRIFDRFERLNQDERKGANGLGLAICRSIVSRHGGAIVARNRTHPRGLEVELTLPKDSSSS